MSELIVREAELVPLDEKTIQPVVDLVIDSVRSPHSKRSYQKGISDFLSWWAKQGRPMLNKGLLQKYRGVLEGLGLSTSTINSRLTVIRRLALEAADNNLIDPALASGITRVRGFRPEGTRVGNWLTKDQAQALISAPDTKTLKGIRDKAIVCVFLGTGLRLSEVANLTFDHLQMREGRWVIVDLLGKGKQVRTVPVPSWCKVAIDNWAQAAGISSGRMFRAVYRYGKLLQPEVREFKNRQGETVQIEGLSPKALVEVVVQYGYGLGFDNLSPHDLRRTWGRLAHKGGADLTQIQLVYGHKSMNTTLKYLGIELNYDMAPCDVLGLHL